jgi:hypothetical protein
MTLLLVFRVIHMVAGVFWAGTMFFVVLLLEPSVRSVGPDGAKVMGALQARGFMTIMPAAALLTILSGIGIYWRIFGPPGSSWVASSYGAVLAAGGIAALVAFVIGVAVMRPATLAAGAIMRSLKDLPEGPERDAPLQRVRALRARSRSAARVVFVLLMLAVVAMAVARYA